MACILKWTDKPRRFLDPALNTTQEVSCFKQGVKKEMSVIQAAAHSSLQKSGLAERLDEKNGYFDYFHVIL
jgi:hypothetical protein